MTQLVNQASCGQRLRRRTRIHIQKRRQAGWADARWGHRCHVAGAAQRCDNRGQGGRVGGVRQLHDDLQRPVEARAEAAREHVKGLPGGLVWRVVAGIAVAQAQGQHGRREGQHDDHAQHRRRPRMALYERRPPHPESRPRRRSPPPAPRDPLAEARDQRRQDGERGEHRHEHRQHRRDGEAVEKLDTQGELPQQRDDHRCAGEQDRPSSRVHRLANRRLNVVAAEEVLAKPGDDEQRVVDAHAKANHRRKLGREGGHADQMRAKARETNPRAKAQQRGHNRQPHRHE